MTSGPTMKLRNRFAELVSREDAKINLAEAALLIAAEEYPRIDVELYLDRLERLGDRVRKQAADAQTPLDIIASLNTALFEHLGFHGNRENYYDPRNSYLNEVIDRRTGIPITLTVVYIDVARHIGLPTKAVGVPSHFVAKHQSAGGDSFIGPFNGGGPLTYEGCKELVREMSGGKLGLQSTHLEAVTNKQVL